MFLNRATSRPVRRCATGREELPLFCVVADRLIPPPAFNGSPPGAFLERGAGRTQAIKYTCLRTLKKYFACAAGGYGLIAEAELGGEDVLAWALTSLPISEAKACFSMRLKCKHFVNGRCFLPLIATMRTIFRDVAYRGHLQAGQPGSEFHGRWNCQPESGAY